MNQDHKENDEIVIAAKPQTVSNDTTVQVNAAHSDLECLSKDESTDSNKEAPSSKSEPLGCSNTEMRPPGGHGRLICDICGNKFMQRYKLKEHLARHNKELRYNCEVCEKMFVTPVGLNKHMRVHTGQKPYDCQYCERRFSDSGSRNKHERTHTGERPYKCTTCNKTFNYSYVLSAHQRTHTGAKRYKCSSCGKGYTKEMYLESHACATATSGAEDIVLVEKRILEGAFDANTSDIGEFFHNFMDLVTEDRLTDSG